MNKNIATTVQYKKRDKQVNKQQQHFKDKCK